MCANVDHLAITYGMRSTATENARLVFPKGSGANKIKIKVSWALAGRSQ